MFNKELLFQTYDSMSFNQVLNDFSEYTQI